ncbi:MAG: hypothetical protein CO186_04745 [Zetaproteobacteria bacterium CG_4_9_14_3_um_filter_49_83]|nr:MAG: hypothetical protein AUJ56_00590 [Zetaproteobacteria bacterium CG1_02_49_23]PIQ31515.1 MAG: hypothetical protein COW62_09630 [Zetaproteobacteria bacterium CG17_big_fil_post_rev_8_21_14_2_50_50_13]PIV29685.1 MAG: hypothetical protein COS35_10690 [Zetaproteobacteria bacterium CG02_land_8_20_14_3_00_50_9]PIY54606.1 MAG: hypothetical protein COZ00_13735 [Zetaproteobacteria bacterium CG_4_10_14_0_8_um_filter_49_80]PJA35664.1 MAG: hypothetical protein CO186_04745 [Zetaproteobacteria bacterium
MQRLIGWMLKRVLLSILLACFCPIWAQAATEVFQVDFIPMNEAKAAVQMQLSPQGNVVIMHSQRKLIVMDDDAAIERVVRLLRQIDVMAQQFSTRVSISSHRREQASGIGVAAVLPGGWGRISARDSRQQSNISQQYQLRLQSGASGSIEVGQVVPLRQSVRAWLTGFGIVLEQQTRLTPVTGGFDISIRAAGENHARVTIHPWLKQLNNRTDAAAIRIDIAEASTELTVPLGQTVTLATTGGDAQQFATALIAATSQNSDQQLQFQFKVDSEH